MVHLRMIFSGYRGIYFSILCYKTYYLSIPYYLCLFIGDYDTHYGMHLRECSSNQVNLVTFTEKGRLKIRDWLLALFQTRDFNLRAHFQ